MPYDKAGRFYPKSRNCITTHAISAIVGATAAMMASAIVVLLGFLFGKSCG